MRKQQQRLIERLLRATEIMVQGGLSETSRRCGNPSCVCYRDPERLHGPHLYITYREDGKSRSLYVPPEHAKTARRGATSLGRFLGDWLFAGQVKPRPFAEAVAAGEAIAPARRGEEQLP